MRRWEACARSAVQARGDQGPRPSAQAVVAVIGYELSGPKLAVTAHAEEVTYGEWSSDHSLRPIYCKHDRSLHAERQALLLLLEKVKKSGASASPHRDPSARTTTRFVGAKP